MKHTAGPWRWALSQDAIGSYGDQPALVGPNNDIICHFGDSTQYYPTEGYPPSDEDSRLIAKAPEMREAIAKLLAITEPDMDAAFEEERADIMAARALLDEIDTGAHKT